MKRFRRACLLAALFVIPNWARAACTIVPWSGGVASTDPIAFTVPGFNTGAIDPNVPDGTILISRRGTFKSPVAFKVECKPYVGVTSYMGSTAPVGFTPDGGITYSSGISGIGMRFFFPPSYLVISALKGYWPRRADLGGILWANIAQELEVEIELVKTGPIMAGGVVAGEIAAWFVQGTAFKIVSFRIDGGIVVEPQVPTCRVTNPAITVPLGNMPASTFTGVGAVSPSKPFNIVLQCSGGKTGTVTNVHTTLTDHTNPGNVSDTLSLASDATATGIGIQVLNGSTVIKYGPDSSATGNTNQWKAGEAGNGTFTIPLTARYIQTAPKVTPGTADGLATFTMSYQ